MIFYDKTQYDDNKKYYLFASLSMISSVNCFTL